MSIQTIKTYYNVAKPGIIFGNLLTAGAGFALASKGSIHFGLFFATLLGLALIIGSGCVFNNHHDRVMDEKMARTKNRALVKGEISLRNALVFAFALIIGGTAILALFTNLLTTVIALAGFVFYVNVYTPLKYRTTHGTLIGSISGAAPPVVGYCAVSGRLDLGALLMFAIVVLWQMPHFYAIAIYRLEDYRAASIPVLPLKKGFQVTKIHMLLYVIAFTLSLAMLTLCGYVGYIFLAVSTFLGIAWLSLSIKGFKEQKEKLWARQMFLFSLVAITVLCIVIPFDVIKG